MYPYIYKQPLGTYFSRLLFLWSPSDTTSLFLEINEIKMLRTKRFAPWRVSD